MLAEVIYNPEGWWFDSQSRLVNDTELAPSYGHLSIKQVLHP